MTNSPDDLQQAVSHTVRNSIADKARSFRAGSAVIEFSDETGADAWPYSTVKTVQLIAYPGADDQHYQCTFTDTSGRRLKVRSHHYASLGAFEDRTSTYRAFVREVLHRLAASGHDVTATSGSSTGRAIWTTLFGGCIAVLVGLALVVLSGGAGVTHAMAPAFVVLLFLPVTWRMMRQGAKSFDPAHPPGEFLGE